jgi:hypothetical protein
MATTGRATAAAVFEDRSHAERAVQELLAAGFGPEQVGVMVLDPGPVVEPPPLHTKTKAGEGAAAGAVRGGVLGGLLGAALATVILPGVGPVLASGLLVAALEGVAAGAAGGGSLGALLGLSIPEDEARHYERHFHSGRTVVTVRAEGRYDEAAAILERVRQTPEVEEHRRARSRLAGLTGEGGETPGTGGAAVPEP